MVFHKHYMLFLGAHLTKLFAMHVSETAKCIEIILLFMTPLLFCLQFVCALQNLQDVV